VPFADPPSSAAWRHVDAREGFEVVFLGSDGGGRRLEGETTAVEEGEAWAVRYDIRLAAGWATRSARVWGHTSSGPRELSLEADGAGRWRVDGAPAAWLDGCLDVDLESSSLTNAFPVQRLGLAVGEEADAPAAYVRALDLAVERLEQRYRRLDDDHQNRQRYHYESPRFGFECVLVYDASGLVLDYPGIAVRSA
jgi:uncharacterized protein